jgi:hypothetical protein
MPMSPSADERTMMIHRSSSNTSEHSLASSYANSIEAMAASVEAAATNRQRPRKSPKKSPKRSKGGGGGGGNSSRQSHYQQQQLPFQKTRKQLFSPTNNKKERRVVSSKLTIGHFVAIVILVPLIMMEAFLSVIVFTYNHNGIIIRSVDNGEGLVAGDDNNNNSAVADDINLNVDDDDVTHPQQEEVVVVESEGEEIEEEEEDVVPEGEETDEEVDDVVPPPTIEDKRSFAMSLDNEVVAKAGSIDVADPQQVVVENEIENDEEEVENDDVEEEEGNVVKSQIVAMQSMLRHALTQLNDASDKDGKEEVETLCLAVWNRGVESLSLPNDNDDEDNDNLRVLAMDAQRCLGGAELAFLSRDVNLDSVTKSRVVFESLSDVDPYDANVRAGLGTSLLILGVMQEVESLLKLAMFHLKDAYSLCQRGAADVQLHSIFQSDASAMSAAILYNLALANISLGDDVSSVSLLLRAAAIRREHSVQSVHLYWNCPDDVLLTIEQQAVLIGAKRTRSQKKKKKSKIPFLSDSSAIEEATA